MVFRSSHWPAVALLTLFFFGCATLPPGPVATPLQGPLPRVVLAEPKIELWVDGTSKVDPAESAKVYQEARVALEKALAGRGLEADDATTVLVVR